MLIVRIRAAIGILITFTLAIHPAQTANAVIVLNPYEDVDWSSWNRFKVNLHTHTTQSDGWMHPAEVIDAYAQKGYAALAITDHNKHTWPWNRWGRDTLAAGLVAIPGSEPSKHDHINSFFCDYDGEHGNLEEALDAVTRKGGLAQINHPGRYRRNAPWYKALFHRYDALFAMEVFNKGDRYGSDRMLWDEVLAITMPARAIWATSGDDMHKAGQIGKNPVIVLSPESVPTLAGIRQALTNGQFFACYDKSRTAENLIFPDSISVNGDSVRIYAQCPDKAIQWISNGRRVHTGSQLVLSDFAPLSSYLRAEIHGKSGARLLLQPFGLGAAIVSKTPDVKNASFNHKTLYESILPTRNSERGFYQR